MKLFSTLFKNFLKTVFKTVKLFQLFQNFFSTFFSFAYTSQVPCFPPYPSKVTATTISLPSIAMETNLVIG